mgnify:CR=1 FL=1
MPNDDSGDAPATQQGVWVGIDLGTSNSAVAIYDSFRGGSKWYVYANALFICCGYSQFSKTQCLTKSSFLTFSSQPLKLRIRLPEVAESSGNNKAGRIMPSVVRFVDDSNHYKDNVLVGYPALIASPENLNDNISNSRNNRSSILRSVKRLLGKRYEDLDPAWIKTLDYDVQKSSQDHDEDDKENSIQLVARTNSPTKTVTTTPQQVLALELKALRKACQVYLDRYRVAKNLHVPGGKGNNELANERYPVVNNVVVGVPHFSQRQVNLVKEACREAGFKGYVGTCLESTAAAVAYGFTLQERSKNSLESSVKRKCDAQTQNQEEVIINGGHTIMVIDMGGGTTDITIASRKRNNRV